MSGTLYVLFEFATGYAVFKRQEGEEIGVKDLGFQQSLQDFSAFQSMVKLVSFMPFTSAEEALEEVVAVSECLLSPTLNNFLTGIFAKRKNKAGWELGVLDPKLGSAIHETLEIPVVSNESIAELTRCLRVHAASLLPEHTDADLKQAECGLGHAFSRNKVKFNVHRSDNMIIQASALLDHMDKGVNQLGMRVKEWYGWHFPELAKEVPEPLKYSQVALILGCRQELNEDDGEAITAKLAEVVEDEALAARVYEKAITSMGGDMAEVDWTNIEAFASKVVSLAQYRLDMQQYLIDKMMAVAPNLTKLIGQQIGAKLISKAGSLTNLAKSPASTIQILGAEKALFRALKKKKGNTPKYGLIFHSSFIQRAGKENKGKISRYLANKSALAARIDCFMEQPPEVFGEKLHEQVEQRLNFFDTGAKPKSNRQVMNDALEQYEALMAKKQKKAKKASRGDEDEDEDIGSSKKKRH